MILCLLALTLQDPFPRHDADPEGTVVDERGAPIADADVALLGEFTTNQFGLAAVQIIGRTPLPAARSDQDGHFVLPLTPEQRSLGDWSGNGQGVFWLVVSKPGHLTWREPLSTGLRGYLGSRVVLPTVEAAGPLAAIPWPPAIVWSENTAGTIVQVNALVGRDLRRKPAISLPASRPGSHRVLIRVRDERGAPIAGARLQFLENAFTSASVAERSWVTDADGTVRLDGLTVRLGEYDIRVVADGYRFGVLAAHTISDEGGVTRHDLTCIAAPLRRCVIVGRDGEPEPFAETMVEYGGKNRFCSLVSDSCGRLLLDVDPRSDRLIDRRLLAPARVDTDTGVWQLTMPSWLHVLVMVDPCPVLGVQWSGSRATGSTSSRRSAPTDAWLVCALGNAEQELRIHPEGGKEVVLKPGDFDERLLGGFRCALLDLRRSAAVPAKKRG